MSIPDRPGRFSLLVCVVVMSVATGPLLAQDASPVLGLADEELVALDSVLVRGQTGGGSGLPSGWVRAQYLMWWTQGTVLPALVTTSPDGTPRAQAGVLGTPDVDVLFGNDFVNNELRSGVRGTGGLWLDSSQYWGVQADWFSVGDDNTSGNYHAASDGDVILARPFFNVVTGLEDSELVSFPNLVSGVVDVTSSSEMHSGALSLRANVREGASGRIDLLGGYRYFRYCESLAIREDLVSTNPGGFVQQGTTFGINDRFQATNDFHGAEVGITGEAFWSFLSLEGAVKTALGSVHQSVEVSGDTVVTTPGDPPVTTAGGFLALPTNIGVASRDDFTFLPQGDLNLKCLITDNFNLTLGYTILYLGEVVRAGEQIDRLVNPTQLTTPDQIGGPAVGDARPQTLLSESDFWAQGLSLGGELLW
jgi:hypothetical protein